MSTYCCQHWECCQQLVDTKKNRTRKTWQLSLRYAITNQTLKFKASLHRGKARLFFQDGWFFPKGFFKTGGFFQKVGISGRF